MRCSRMMALIILVHLKLLTLHCLILKTGLAVFLVSIICKFVKLSFFWLVADRLMHTVFNH